MLHSPKQYWIGGDHHPSGVRKTGCPVWVYVPSPFTYSPYLVLPTNGFVSTLGLNFQEARRLLGLDLGNEGERQV